LGKNIVIDVAGVETELNNTTKFITSTHEGTSVSWVPEDSVELTEKTITENGTYAPAAGEYAWSKVTVAVESLTGTLQNGDAFELTLVDGEPTITITRS